MEELLSDSVEHLFGESCTPREVRQIEGGGSPASLWRQIEESGFVDALLSEADGGAGLGLRDVFTIFEACGKYAVPVPLAQTMVARAILKSEHCEVPAGSITFATRTSDSNQRAIVASHVPYGAVADWVLASLGHNFALLPTKDAVKTLGGHGSLDADLSWSGAAAEKALIRPSTAYDWNAIEACLFATQLAGAMGKVFTSSLQYANERSQFGRTIGKFQAIQHQLSVMAEQASAARMAARIGCSSATHVPNFLAAAVAKARTSEAAAIVAASGHAIHGAIGITEEFDLQLFTRRLHQWRICAGSESYWNARIGDALIAKTDYSVLDFIRSELQTQDTKEQA